MNLHSSDAVGAEVARLLGALPTVRPLRAGDRALLDAFFRGLAPASRHRRFLGAVNALPAALLDRWSAVGAPGEAGFLAITTARGAERAIGEARYAASGERCDAAEFALVVDDAWQRMGVGARLLRRLIEGAARSGFARMFGDTFADNVPMLALAQRLGFDRQRHPVDGRLVRMTRSLDGAIAELAAAAEPRRSAACTSPGG